MRRLIAVTATAACCLASGGALAASSAPTSASAPAAHATTAHAAQPITTTAPAASPHWARATIHSSSGAYVGTATFRDTSRGTQVNVQGRWLKPGFHGLHIHAIGKCAKNSVDPTDATKKGAFLSAGGHRAKGKQSHPDHAGDLGVVLANADTRAKYSIVTDRFKVADLFDANGSALMIHQGSDNFANIPERYAPDGPDAATLKAGDGGARAACGVVRR